MEDATDSSDAIADISLEWLKKGWDRKKPFFMMHHFKAPHDMFQNAKRYESYLADVKIPEPANLHNQPAEGFGSIATRKYGAGLTKNFLRIDNPCHSGSGQNVGGVRPYSVTQINHR